MENRQFLFEATQNFVGVHPVFPLCAEKRLPLAFVPQRLPVIEKKK
jgi:hypothetical protein